MLLNRDPCNSLRHANILQSVGKSEEVEWIVSGEGPCHSDDEDECDLLIGGSGRCSKPPLKYTAYNKPIIHVNII